MPTGMCLVNSDTIPTAKRVSRPAQSTPISCSRVNGKSRAWASITTEQDFREAPPKRSGAGYPPKIGRFLSADTIVQSYANPQSLKHAVTHPGSTQKYWYDANGNQITRVVGADTFNLIYDAENRLVEVKKNSVSMATFVYDGDGRRVKSTINGTTTTFVGSHYEVTGSTVTKYYFAGSQRVAMRKYTIPQPMTVEYFLGDHLGSTSITADSTGAKVSEMRYKPWGEVRYSWTAGLSATPAYKLPDYTFTGQFSYMDDPSTSGVTEGFGLLYYGARFYDPAIGRFISADSITPGGVQGLDRYAYVSNNPLRYVDPSGHVEACNPNDGDVCEHDDSGGNNNNNNDGGGGGGGGGSGGNDDGNNDCEICGDIDDALQGLFGGHAYGVVASPVCLPLPWINCTDSETDNYLAGNQYPGQLPWEPVQPGGRYNVFPEKFGDINLLGRWFPGSGAINVVIEGNTITNVARPTHIFYKGYVGRKSYVGPLGMTYVETYGEGYNDGFEVGNHTVPGWAIDQANNVVGPIAFKALNLQLVLYTTWVETGQALTGTQQP